MKDVFICHAGSDKESYVRPLIKKLSEYNISYWVDEAEISWGDSIIKKINEGISSSHYVLVLITQNFLNKNWPQKELYNALNLEIYNDRVIVLPIICVSENVVFEKYPLLCDKLHLKWEDGIDKISQELASLLERNNKVNKVKSNNVINSLWALGASAMDYHKTGVISQIVYAKTESDAMSKADNLANTYFPPYDGYVNHQIKVLKIPNSMINSSLCSIAFASGKTSRLFNIKPRLDLTICSAETEDSISEQGDDYIRRNNLNQPCSFSAYKVSKRELNEFFEK